MDSTARGRGHGVFGYHTRRPRNYNVTVFVTDRLKTQKCLRPVNGVNFRLKSAACEDGMATLAPQRMLMLRGLCLT